MPYWPWPDGGDDGQGTAGRVENPTPIRESSTSFYASPALFAEAVHEGYFPAAAGIDSELEEVVHGIHDVLQYSAMADTRS